MASNSYTSVSTSIDFNNKDKKNLKNIDFDNKNNNISNHANSSSIINNDIVPIHSKNDIIISKSPINNYQYQLSKMIINLNNVKLFKNPLDILNIFDIDTIYHYCNLIIDQFDNRIQSLALFKDDQNFGPKNKKIDIYFHPFQWKHQWHLAIGFTKYNKILFVHCSNYNHSNNENLIKYPSFPEQTSLRVKQFILFFKQKLSKNSLKYPRLYSDLFEPVSESNAINLLTVIFAFCLDPISLTKSFCDPEFSPTKFEISDFYPIIENLDLNFRNELKSIEEKNNLIELTKKQKLENEKIEKEKLKNEKLHKEKLKSEKLEIERLEIEAKKQQLIIEKRLKLEKDERERRAKERQERNNKLTTGLNLKNNINNLNIHTADNNTENNIENNIKNNSENNLILKREYDLIQNKDDTIVKRQKTKPRLASSGKSINQPIEINDLEDSEESSNEEPGLSIKTFSSDKTHKQYEETLKKIFTVNYALEFKKNIHNLTLLGDSKALNLIYKLIRDFCYNNFLNPLLFEKSNENIIKKGFFDIRECLVVTYKRRMKQEFDEKKFEKILDERDSSNQIFPLIFENGSIFLINIKKLDSLNCIVKLVCVTNRTNRSEREIMKNYAFRRLIEIYVNKYNRLIIKIRTSIIIIKHSEFYKITLASFFILQRILWNNKFELAFKPKFENLESYNVYFEKMMTSIEKRDMFQTELNLKRIIKHVSVG